MRSTQAELASTNKSFLSAVAGAFAGGRIFSKKYIVEIFIKQSLQNRSEFFGKYSS